MQSNTQADSVDELIVEVEEMQCNEQFAVDELVFLFRFHHAVQLGNRLDKMCTAYTNNSKDTCIRAVHS